MLEPLDFLAAYWYTGTLYRGCAGITARAALLLLRAPLCAYPISVYISCLRAPLCAYPMRMPGAHAGSALSDAHAHLRLSRMRYQTQLMHHTRYAIRGYVYAIRTHSSCVLMHHARYGITYAHIRI
jgi:hypothetical protein